MSMAELLKTYKTKDIDKKIVGKVERNMMKNKSGKDKRCVYDPPRSNKIYHPSSIANTECLRQLQLKKLNVEKTNDTYNAHSQRIFDTGHDFGYRFQEYLYYLGILLGRWHCVECKYEWMDVENPSPSTCPSCGVDLTIWYNLHYMEVPVHNDEYNLGGQADAMIKQSWGRQMIELKTIKCRGEYNSEYSVSFEDLQAPKPAHVKQLNIYMDNAKRQYDGIQDLDRGLIIYQGKNNQKLKQFPVKLQKGLVNNLYDKIKMVRHSIEQGFLYPRAGKNKSCRMCKWCDYKTLCWDELGNGGKEKGKEDFKKLVK